MTLYEMIDAALTCQQEHADGSMTPLLAKSRRAPMRSSIKRYATMLEIYPAAAIPDTYHRPDHDIRALIEAKSPTTLAPTTCAT